MEMTRESFVATMAFGRLALSMLFLAGLVIGPHAVVYWSIIAAAGAYVAQLLYTQSAVKLGALFQSASLVSGIVGFLVLVR